jgi:hypothetical protein
MDPHGERSAPENVNIPVRLDLFVLDGMQATSDHSGSLSEKGGPIHRRFQVQFIDDARSIRRVRCCRQFIRQGRECFHEEWRLGRPATDFIYNKVL